MENDKNSEMPLPMRAVYYMFLKNPGYSPEKDNKAAKFLADFRIHAAESKNINNDLYNNLSFYEKLKMVMKVLILTNKLDNLENIVLPGTSPTMLMMKR